HPPTVVLCCQPPAFFNRLTLYSHSRPDSPHGLSLEWLVAQPRGERHLIDARDAIARWIDDDVMIEALSRLSPQAREALLLRHVHGYSGPEIAEMLDISVMAAYQRVHRAEVDFRRYQQTLDTD
ncbi:MAG TPA: sigma-70 region 4 domain-containing protein, partial [Thermomicrobiales bacterium]|nr:sigma-70 region 4 domain-containing protein [Thermomicrobiales bacterium]